MVLFIIHSIENKQSVELFLSNTQNILATGRIEPSIKCISLKHTIEECWRPCSRETPLCFLSNGVKCIMVDAQKHSTGHCPVLFFASPDKKLFSQDTL